jgi:hypothetical protein
MCHVWGLQPDTPPISLTAQLQLRNRTPTQETVYALIWIHDCLIIGVHLGDEIRHHVHTVRHIPCCYSNMDCRNPPDNNNLSKPRMYICIRVVPFFHSLALIQLSLWTKVLYSTSSESTCRGKREL